MKGNGVCGVFLNDVDVFQYIMLNEFMIKRNKNIFYFFVFDGIVFMKVCLCVNLVYIVQMVYIY